MSLQSDHDDDYASAADDSALSSEEEEDGDSMAEDDIYDGSIEGDVLMKKLPTTQGEAAELRELVRQNPPVIYGRLVSRPDEKGALITAASQGVGPNAADGGYAPSSAPAGRTRLAL